MNPELFNVPIQKSPRLLWMEKYELKVFDFGPEHVNVECSETGHDIKRFSVGCGAANYEDGDTEDEAIAAWAKANSVKLWNEE